MPIGNTRVGRDMVNLSLVLGTCLKLIIDRGCNRSVSNYKLCRAAMPSASTPWHGVLTLRPLWMRRTAVQDAEVGVAATSFDPVHLNSM